MDFLCDRTFRQTLLVHADQSVDRHITAERVKNLWISSVARPVSTNPNLAEGVVEKFCTPNGMCVNTPSALTKSAFVTLAARGPAAIAVSDLVASVHSRLHPLAGKPPGEDMFKALANDLLQGYALGVVELHGGASPFTVEPGTRPVASPLARYQAERGGRVTTLRHESIVVPDAIRRLIPLLDGGRTIDEIAAAVDRHKPGVFSKFADPAALKTAVNDIARYALIAS